MRRLAVLLALLLLAPSIVAQEVVNLSVSESNSQYHVSGMVLDVDNGVLSITLRGADDKTVNCSYNAGTTPTGLSLLVGLNKANLSTAYAGNATTGSLKQRIAHRLIVMGESTAICGKTITGTLAGSVP